MTDPTFRAKFRPELHPAAAELVKVYNDTYGSAGPGCCPEALAAVLEHLLTTKTFEFSEWEGDMHRHFFYLTVGTLKALAARLRGEEP